MTTVFGKQDIKEKQIIRTTIIIYIVIFFIRIISLLLLITDRTSFIKEYYSKSLEFELIMSLLWTITDLIPVVFLFRVHYLNFISFEGQEVLETQYPSRNTQQSYNLTFTTERDDLDSYETPSSSSSDSDGYIKVEIVGPKFKDKRKK